MKLKISTPEDFIELIPRTIPENIVFRQELHSILAKDKAAQVDFLQMCYLKPQIAFDTAFWTFDPRQPHGLRNLPFILRIPKHIECVNTIKDAIDNEHTLIINKSRDEGATEMICKFFCLYWLLVGETMFLVGSRKEEFVDRTGDHKSLFHKIEYGIRTKNRTKD